MNGDRTLFFHGMESPDDRSDRMMCRINERPCPNASRDKDACLTLLRRLEAAAGRGENVTYSSLVRDVTFTLQGSDGFKRAHKIDMQFLRHADEELIQEYARYLGAASFRDHGVFLNALLIPNEKRRYPAPMFFQWIDAIRGLDYVEDSPSHRSWWEREVSKVARVYGDSPSEPVDSRNH